MTVGPPATRTDEYLAAILDELRALRVAVEGGGPQESAVDAPVPVDGTGGAAAPPPATKRTRQRSAGQN